MEYIWILVGVAVAIGIYAIYRILRAFYNIILPYVLSRPLNLKKKSGASWAVVTGATDGIGKSYSFELARRGFNIYLVSRTASKLERTRRELLEKHPNVEVRIATFDFTNTSVEDYKVLLKCLNEVNVGVLINNVGMFYEYPEVLHKVEGGIDRLSNIVVVNNLPPTLLSAGILPQMVARKSGIIVNIGSGSGAATMAKWAVYSAAKKYISWFTEILRKEYKNQGIIFQTITPFLVATNMTGNPDTSFFIPDSDRFARSALNTIGNASETTGYIGHQVQFEIMSLMPEFILDFVTSLTNDKLRNAAVSKLKPGDIRL